MQSIENVASIMALFKLPFYTFLGAFTLYVLNRLHSKQPFSLLQALNVNVGKTGSPFIILLDMVLSSTLGAALVIQLTLPATVPQAVMAGLGMTGILSVRGKQE